MTVQLYEHQLEAIDKLHSGKILYGDVGTGKTYTGLGFYLKAYSNRKLVVITTAKKRNDGDWQKEAADMGITDLDVDSYNNIEKYVDLTGHFFIFDEQRLVGNGTWVKSFLKIARKNKWILLTGTPGDTWMDYLPVFLANGYYPNKTAFINEHVEYDRFVKFPKVKRYHNVDKLERLRKRILVRMHMERKTIRNRTFVETGHDAGLVRLAVDGHWDPFNDKPIENPSQMTHIVRRIVATSDDRIHEAAWQLMKHKRLIVFYNYDYELDILVDLCEFLGLHVTQYNGHKHEDVSDKDRWVHLVQYTAGAEGWNCTSTDQMLFYSYNYSWKIIEQAEGRIDRLNTPYTNLYYTVLTSKADIDESVVRAYFTKKKFNATAWARKAGKWDE